MLVVSFDSLLVFSSIAFVILFGLISALPLASVYVKRLPMKEKLFNSSAKLVEAFIAKKWLVWFFIVPATFFVIVAVLCLVSNFLSGNQILIDITNGLALVSTLIIFAGIFYLICFMIHIPRDELEKILEYAP